MIVRKSHLLVLALFVVVAIATHANAQTTYTVTADGCGTKITPMFCTLPTDNGPIVLDNRAPYRLGYLELPSSTWVHGAYSGFVSNPDGTRGDFYGTGAYLSDDRTVVGTFNYHAHYVNVCSGRGCGGTLGWHYVILAGSTVEVTPPQTADGSDPMPICRKIRTCLPLASN